MATARPYWKGYLKLSLVSCSIALYPSTSASERVSVYVTVENEGTTDAALPCEIGTVAPTGALKMT